MKIFDFKNFKNKKKEVSNKDTEKRLPKMSGPDEYEEMEFPVIYAILTEEIEKETRMDRNYVGLFNDGYTIICRDEEELEKCKNKYPVGGYYMGEKITDIDYKPMKDTNY